MNLSLTETQRQVQSAARAFAQDRVKPGAAERDRTERFPKELFAEMAELGLLGVNVPAELGGAEAGAVAYALAVREIAQACASTSVTMAVTNMCAELIADIGTPLQRSHFVPLLTSGKAVCGAFALSEPQAGSDASALTTRAEKRGNTYVINGAKQWISHGAYAGVMVVWARTGVAGPKGLSCFLLEGRPAGLTIGKPEDKMGLRSSGTVPLNFENVEVPASNLLGQEGQGFSLAMRALDGGRIGIAAQACGVGRAAFEAAKQYAKERRAFGQPIAELQAIRWFLADMRTELEAAELLMLRAAQKKESGQPFTQESAMAKLFASEMSNAVCAKAVQIHGGYGYVNEFPVERYFRDARVQTIYEGTSEIQRLVIARSLL